MKIVLVNAVDNGGGAAIACSRLAEALKLDGNDVSILVQKSKGDGHELSEPILSSKIQKIPYFLRGKKQEKLLDKYPNQKALFSYPLGSDNIHKHKLLQEADVIHLHWVNDNFLSLKDIKKITDLGKPVFVTMHDMWYFTGGCHYTGNCSKYVTHCGACPILGSDDEHDLAYKVFEEKLNTLTKADIVYITPSKWLEEVAKTSKLLSDKRIVTVANTIDTSLYKPIEQTDALKSWGVDIKEGVRYVLFGAVDAVDDERKGFKYLVDALNEIPTSENIELLVFGSKELKVDLPFKTHNLGWISDKRQMINAYNAADVFVTPSLEDNLPNTIMEAMACGTPCVGFKTGGIPEMIDHKITGYIASQKDVTQMAEGILNVLANREQYSKNSIDKVSLRYTYESIAKKHMQLYLG